MRSERSGSVARWMAAVDGPCISPRRTGPMVAVVRLPTSGGSAACLVPLFFHVDGTSTQWLFGDSLPTNRRLAIQYLIEVFQLIEHEYSMVRRSLIRPSSPLAAFSRQDAAASPLTA